MRKIVNVISLFLALSSVEIISLERRFVKSVDIEIFDPYEFHLPTAVEPIPETLIIPDLSSCVDLEESAQDFVLESKQIFIEEYPTAFNPTIVRWNGALLMAFRIRHPKTGSTDKIGMVWLDENFDLNGPTYVLEVPPYPSTVPSKQQDPRLIVIGDQLYMVYSNIIRGIISQEVRRMFITKVYFDGIQFYTDAPEGIFYFEDEKEARWEKNWVPFDYEGEMYLAYSIAPHRILKPLFGTNSCESFASSKSAFDWKWGYPRGGTQAYKDGDKYLSFFHSSINMPTVHSHGKNFPHYFFGAYTFSLTPPFEITHVSPEPIIGKGFYSGPAYKTWKPLRVVFPDGFVFNEDYVWILYGKQDHEIWVAKLDKRKLLESLVPVNSISE